MKEVKNTFETLSLVDVSGKIEKKNGLDYLSWSHAWSQVKSRYPDASYKFIRHDDNGISRLYSFDERTGYFVETEITIEGETLGMILPVMDFKNQSNMNAKVTDINKALMRCLSKNIAMFGLAINLYTGEDVPRQEFISADELSKIKEKLELLSKRGKVSVTAVRGSLLNKIKVKNMDEIPESALPDIEKFFLLLEENARKLEEATKAKQAPKATKTVKVKEKVNDEA